MKKRKSQKDASHLKIASHSKRQENIEKDNKWKIYFMFFI